MKKIPWNMLLAAGSLLLAAAILLGEAGWIPHGLRLFLMGLAVAMPASTRVRRSPHRLLTPRKLSRIMIDYDNEEIAAPARHCPIRQAGCHTARRNRACNPPRSWRIFSDILGSRSTYGTVCDLRSNGAEPGGF